MNIDPIKLMRLMSAVKGKTMSDLSPEFIQTCGDMIGLSFTPEQASRLLTAAGSADPGVDLVAWFSAHMDSDEFKDMMDPGRNTFTTRCPHCLEPHQIKFA
jgi:hypothetical protein